MRGFRIELDEIQVTLNQHPAVRENIVLLREDRLAEKRLVAYLLLQPSERIEQAELFEELRQFLRERLPEYMIPAAFCVLDAWPLSSNGKLNYLALPLPDQQVVPTRQFSALAHTAVEQELLQLWRELLGVETIGIEDNFFDLGGHSLLLVRLHNEVQKRFHKAIPLLALFQYTTIRRLASYLEENEASSSSLQHRYARAEKRREFLQRPKRFGIEQAENGRGV
jgi:acyl carrier protein